MNVYPIGTKVRLANNSINGVITAITIRGTTVSYECNWWSGRERKSEWLQEIEFEVSLQPTLEIGFKHVPKD